MPEPLQEGKELAAQLRVDSIRCTTAAGSLTSIVSQVTPPGGCSGTCPVHDGPAHRHDRSGLAQSSDTMAPGTSPG